MPTRTADYITGHGQPIVNVHEQNEDCERGCVIHNPSDHTMKNFPTLWRSDWGGFMERVCPHGIGHPDPDGVAFVAKTRGVKAAQTHSVHGCDGCCRGAYTRFAAIMEA